MCVLDGRDEIIRRIIIVVDATRMYISYPSVSMIDAGIEDIIYAISTGLTRAFSKVHHRRRRRKSVYNNDISARACERVITLRDDEWRTHILRRFSHALLLNSPFFSHKSCAGLRSLVIKTLGVCVCVTTCISSR